MHDCVPDLAPVYCVEVELGRRPFLANRVTCAAIPEAFLGAGLFNNNDDEVGGVIIGVDNFFVHI